jgi:hypothetical protein
VSAESKKMRVKYKRRYEISYYTNNDIFRVNYRYGKSELLKVDETAVHGSHKIERQIETYDDKDEAEARVESLKSDSNYYMVRIRSYKQE